MHTKNDLMEKKLEIGKIMNKKVLVVHCLQLGMESDSAKLLPLF